MPVKKKKTPKKSVKKRIVKKKTVKKAIKRAIKKKAIKKRPLKKQALKKKPAKKKIAVVKKPKEEGNLVGAITHYFPKVRAAVIKLKASLSVGETLRFKGHTTDFTQNITSMQIDHVPVNQAQKGAEIGLLVDSRVRQHDKVYKV